MIFCIKLTKWGKCGNIIIGGIMLRDVVKKSNSYNRLKIEICHDRLNHALMFVCQDEIYMEEYLKQFLSLVFCENDIHDGACGKCKGCISAYNLTNPDILIYGKNKVIDKDDAEDIVSNAPLRPYSSNKKVYVLYNYDQVNKTVENKLLKTIEEPPKDVVFVLLVSNVNKILQTTLSRVQKVFLEPISYSDLIQLLKDENIANPEVIAGSSCGSIKKALSYAQNNDIISIQQLVLDLLSNMDATPKILSYSLKVMQFSDNIDDFLNSLQLTISDIIKVKANFTDGISNKLNLDKLSQIASMYSYTALTKIVEQTYISKQMAEVNVTKNNIIDQLLLKIVEVRLKCKR